MAWANSLSGQYTQLNWTYSFQLRLWVLIQHITIVLTAGELDWSTCSVIWGKCGAEPDLLQLKKESQNKVIFKMCNTQMKS